MNNLSQFVCLLVFLSSCTKDVLKDPSETLLLLPSNETSCLPIPEPEAFPLCTRDQFLAPPYGWFSARVNGETVVGSASAVYLDTISSYDPSGRRICLTFQTHLAGSCINTSSLVIENVLPSPIGELQAAPYYGLSTSYAADYDAGIITEAASYYAIQEYDIDYAYYQPDTNVHSQPAFVIDCINLQDTLVSGRGIGRFLLDPDSGDSLDGFSDTLVVDSLVYQARIFN